eukprot:SAG22_NODE_8603_length_642_cov_0.935543_1_plen_36_part_10
MFVLGPATAGSLIWAWRNGRIEAIRHLVKCAFVPFK